MKTNPNLCNKCKYHMKSRGNSCHLRYDELNGFLEGFSMEQDSKMYVYNVEQHDFVIPRDCPYALEHILGDSKNERC